MKSFIASCAFMGMAVLAGSAIASPLGVSGKPGATEALTTRVAIVCIRDDRGWHHMRGERRVTCRPAMPREGAKFWKWRCDGPRCGYWHRHENRWND